MTHYATPAERARRYFEAVWQQGDHWDLEAALDETSRARQLSVLADRRYARALEIGCGAGAFTELLATIADRLVAIDVAPSAIARARARGLDPNRVDLRVSDALDFDLTAEQPWDLIVMSETVYCLGWLYPLFDLAWFARRLHEALAPQGRLLMANTYGRERDHLLAPPLIDTYRDLFRNTGFSVEREEMVEGEKGSVAFRIAVTLFRP